MTTTAYTIRTDYEGAYAEGPDGRVIVANVALPGCIAEPRAMAARTVPRLERLLDRAGLLAPSEVV